MWQKRLQSSSQQSGRCLWPEAVDAETFPGPRGRELIRRRQHQSFSRRQYWPNETSGEGRGWSAAGVSWPTFSWEVTLLCFPPTAGFGESGNKLNYSFIWFLFRTRERERERANTLIQFSRQRLSVGKETGLFSLRRLRRSLIVFAGTRPRPSCVTWSKARKPPRSSIVIIVVGLLARDEFERFNIEICYEYVDHYKYNLLVIIVAIKN